MGIRDLDKGEGWVDRALGGLMAYPKTARVVFIVALAVIAAGLVLVVT